MYIRIILHIIAVGILIYSAFSFSYFNLNPQNWTGTDRLLFSLIFLAISTIIIVGNMIYYEEKEKK